MQRGLKNDLIFNNIGSENIWIGIDDTDSRNGGCTTYLACAIISKITDERYDIIGYPRLVRLNPNIPWKTRGNGAVSIKIGKGAGKKSKIGEVNGAEIFSFSKEESKEFDTRSIKKMIEQIIAKHAKLDDENTNSGFVLLDKKPCFETYEKTVREIIELDKTKELLESISAEYKGYKNSRGLIGATASIAWSPKNDKTYELIAYREEKMWGKDRSVDDLSAQKMDKTYESTFDNYDYENKHNRLVPSSPCPVLFGIRGNNQNDLNKARYLIKSEKIESWIIFETNQGTDEHLQMKKIGDIQPFQSVIASGTICKNPYTIEGGHVIFSIKDSSGEIDCAAYEPTKQFREIIRKLIIGDKVEVYGGVRQKPLTINLEKINIIHIEKRVEKIENPICPKCGKHMKSKGKDQGFKCKICGLKSEKPVLKEIDRQIHTGFYEVPVCSRRHLSKPLKRMN